MTLSQVRVPLADGTVMKAPEVIADSALVLMADIFPTGLFAANNAFKDMTKDQISEATVVVIGCGYASLTNCIRDLSSQLCIVLSDFAP